MTSKSSATKKQETPWSVRGVSHETRTAAKKAARRANLTIGEWMERTLWEAIQRDLKSEPSQLPSVGIEETLLKIVDRLEAQNARLDAVETKRNFFYFFRWKRTR